MKASKKSTWAAIGAAVAVTLGAGGVSFTQAALTSGDKPVFVALAEPCRLVDTRPTTNIGPKNTPISAGETNAYEIQVTGANGNCTGSLAIPAEATAVATNVAAIAPSAPSGRSFFTIYPADVALPTTANLNFVDGQPPTPNKVDVGLSADGKIKIFNNDGSAHAAVDVFGYYIDHNHDDRYYTETEIDAALDAKANSADILPAPGVVSNTEDESTTLSGTVARVVSTSIRVPADGFLVVNVSGTFSTDGAGGQLAFCRITKGGTAGSIPIIGSDIEPYTTLSDFGASGAQISGFSAHRVLPVSVADNPLFITTGQAIGFDCQRAGSDTISVTNAHISATYVPRSYAPVGFVFPTL